MLLFFERMVATMNIISITNTNNQEKALFYVRKTIENNWPKGLKRALMNNVQDFLMELGRGFAFVGREYRLIVVNLEY